MPVETMGEILNRVEAEAIEPTPPSLDVVSTHAFKAYWGAQDRTTESLAVALIELIRYLQSKEKPHA